MKKMMKRTLLPVFLIIFLFDLTCYSQTWGGLKPTGLASRWSVNVGGGLTSYFGDLSLHDLDIVAKLERESGPALNISVVKNVFGDAIGISGQVVAGKIKGMKGDISFNAELLEYNLNARVDFVDLFMQGRYHAFGLTGYVGAGQFLFSTKKVESNERVVTNYEHSSRVPEFVVFFGGGIYYKINQNIGITADLALRQCQNDRLDDYVKNDDYDYYSLITIGISYYVNNMKRAPLKNKARLANSSYRFRSPANPAEY